MKSVGRAKTRANKGRHWQQHRNRSVAVALTTIGEVAEWREGVTNELGDPSLAVCQLFFRWVAAPRARRNDDLVCGLEDRVVLLRFGASTFIYLPVDSESPRLRSHGSVASFGAKRIAPGLWSLFPSLNIPGGIHAFIALHGVPDPAPWDHLILLVSA